MTKRKREQESNAKISALRLYNQAIDLSLQNQDELALQTLEESMRLYEGNLPERHALLASLQINVGLLTDDKSLYKEALNNYKLHRQMVPTSWQSYHGLVVANYLLYKDEDAKAALFKMLQYSANVELVKEWALKLDCLEEVIELYESKLKPYKSLTTNLSQEDYEYSVEIQKSIIELEDNNSSNYEWLAYLSFQAKRPDECFLALEKAISLQPNNFHLYYTYAFTLLKTNGDVAKAVDALENAIELAFNVEQINKIISTFIENEQTGSYLKIADSAYSNLAFIEIENKNYEAALEAAEKALSYNEEKYEIHTLVGRIYFLLGDYESACRFYDNAYELNKTHIETQINKLTCIAETGRIEDAYAELVLITGNPKIKSKAEYAECIEKVKKIIHDKAIEVGFLEKKISETFPLLVKPVVISALDGAHTPSSDIIIEPCLIPGLSDDSDHEDSDHEDSNSVNEFGTLGAYYSAMNELDSWLAGN